jgi:hypothetical protein
LNDDSKATERAITRALADTDLYFSVGATERGTLWSLGFRIPEEEQSLQLVMRLERASLIVTYSMASKLAPEHMTDVLRLNGSLLTARVGLDTGGTVIVWGDLLPLDVSPTSLTRLFTAIVGGAQQVRRIQSGTPFEIPGQATAQ